MESKSRENTRHIGRKRPNENLMGKVETTLSSPHGLETFFS